jgi:hypothetical protein
MDDAEPVWDSRRPTRRRCAELAREAPGGSARHWSLHHSRGFRMARGRRHQCGAHPARALDLRSAVSYHAKYGPSPPFVTGHRDPGSRAQWAGDLVCASCSTHAAPDARTGSTTAASRMSASGTAR